MLETASTPSSPGGDVAASVDGAGPRRAPARRPGHLRDHLDLALDAGGLGAWEWDIASGRVTWDAVLEGIYGLPPGGFDGSEATYRSLIHPDDREEVAAVVAAARRAARRYETEHRIVRPDGTVRWTHGWARPLFDEAGEVVAFIGVVADITARRVAEEERERALAEATAARAEAEAARAEAERAAERYAAVAGTLQRSLLPPVPPAIPGIDVAASYHPALDGLSVGGDFYDVPMVGRRTWALLVGDVSGKGAEAAAVTGLVRYSARAAAVQAATPAGVLARVDEVLRHDQADEVDARFATMLFALLRLRPRGLAITFALAGHPPPYLVRPDGTVRTVGRPGTLLGVLPDPDFSDTRVTLRAGDAFVVVTDGVLEARDREGTPLADRLPEILARHAPEGAAALASAVEQAALAWQVGAAHDDIAVVVLRVPGEEVGAGPAEREAGSPPTGD